MKLLTAIIVGLALLACTGSSGRYEAPSQPQAAPPAPAAPAAAPVAPVGTAAPFVPPAFLITGIDKGKLERLITDGLNDRLTALGDPIRIRSVVCIQDGDGFHFRCLATDTIGQSAAVRAICDRDNGGRCLWEVAQ